MKNPFSKFIVITLPISFLVGVLLGYLALDQMGVDGTDPVEVTSNVRSLQSWLTWTYLLGFPALMTLCNFAFFKEKRPGWSFLATGIWFVLLVALDYLWVGPALWRFRKEAGLWEGGFEIGPFIGIVLIGLGVFAVLLNFIIVRVVRKKRATA